MNILVCVKRVPNTGSKITVTEDGQRIETRALGFVISPHEECAVEEAVQIKEKHGADTFVLTLGEEVAIEQLRGSMSVGVAQAILLETSEKEWGPMATAQAIIDAVKAHDTKFDMIFFGNEAADTGGYQVGIRVAHALDMPCVSGIKGLDVNPEAGTAVGKREAPDGWDNYEVSLPAVFTMKEGINLPRYPPLKGKLRAKKAPIERITPEASEEGFKKTMLRTPPKQESSVVILGKGAEAAPKIVELLQKLGMVDA